MGTSSTSLIYAITANETIKSKSFSNQNSQKKIKVDFVISNWWQDNNFVFSSTKKTLLKQKKNKSNLNIKCKVDKVLK